VENAYKFTSGGARMKRLKLLVVVALALVICLPVMANATWYMTDQGNYDNYPEAGYPPVSLDKIFFEITSGATFEGGGVIGYGAGFSGWTVTPIDDQHVVATNNSAPTSATWNYQFTGSPVANWGLYWDGYLNGVFQVGESDVTTNGAIYAGPRGNGDYYYDAPRGEVVPLPPTVLLLGSGLLGLVGWRRVRKG
jgi:hypothetical protein